MNNFPQAPQAPSANSNKRTWIILGAVIGVLVIVMGGCVACGALIGLSRLSDENDPGAANENRGVTSGRRASSGGLAGTSWTGTLDCDDGANLPVNYKFAESGNPLYDYQTKSGLRSVELSEAGQSLRFVPPEGGVTNITFESLDVSAERMSHSMRVSKERTGGGTLVQSQASIQTEAVLSGSELEVETSIRSQSVASQPGIMAPGDEQVVICRGKLRPQ